MSEKCGLVPGHVFIHLFSPGVKPAFQVHNILEPCRLQVVADLQTAHTKMADDNRPGVRFQFIHPFSDFVHGNVHGVGQPADFKFPRLAYVKQDGLVLVGL